MKNIFKLIFLLVCTCVRIHAQDLNFSLTWGREFDEPNFDFTFLRTGDTTEYLAHSSSLGDPTFRRFSKEKNLIVSRGLDFKRQRPFVLASKMYLLYEAKNKNDEKMLYADEYDPKALNTKNKAVELFPASEIAGITVSRDGHHLLIRRRLGKKKTRRVVYSLFSEQLQKIWEKELLRADSIKVFGSQSDWIDEAGNLYSLVLKANGNPIKINGANSNHSYELISIVDNGQRVSQIPIKLEGVSITNILMRKKEGILYCSGFYSKKEWTGAKGYFLIKIDPVKNEIISTVQADFDQSLVSANGMPGKKTNDDELSHFRLQHFILTKDNSFVLVAEQIDETYSLGGRTTTHHDYYFYNNIVVLSLKPTGEVNWITTIAKRQETEDDGASYSSYQLTCAQCSNRMFFLFNDTPKNYPVMDVKPERFTGRQSVFVVASIDQNGNMNKQVILTEQKDVFIRPAQCLQVSQRDVLIYGERSHKGRVGILGLNSD